MTCSVRNGQKVTGSRHVDDDDRPGDGPEPDRDEERPAVGPPQPRHRETPMSTTRTTSVAMPSRTPGTGATAAPARASPRAVAEVGGREAAVHGWPDRSRRDHRGSLPAPMTRRTGSANVEPAGPRRAVEQRRDDATGDRPADDHEAKLEAADARVEDRAGMRAKYCRVEQHVPEPADRRPRPARRRGRRTGDRRRGVSSRADRGQRDPKEDRGTRSRASQRTTPSPMMEVRVEVEGDHGERTRAECSDAAESRVGREWPHPCPQPARDSFPLALSTGRHLACRTPAHRGVGHATIIRPSVAALGAGDRRHARGRVGGHPRGGRSSRGTSADRRRTSGPRGDGPGRSGAAGDAMTADTTTGPTLAVRLLGTARDRRLRSARSTRRPARPGARRAAGPPPPSRLRDAIAADLWPDFDGPSALLRAGAVARCPDRHRRPAWSRTRSSRSARTRLACGRSSSSTPTSRQFEALVGDGRQSAGRALALYRGDLAEGLGHECFAADRERLSDL